MSDRWVLAHDPREGEHPEPMDNCQHGIDRNEAACFKCEWRDEEPRNVTSDARARSLVAMLDRLQMVEDERMGAHFAARFDRENES